LLAYRLVAGAWLRSALAYRWQFWLELTGNALITFLDFAVLAVMYAHVRHLGGFSLAEAGFLYGTSGVCLGLADTLMGSTERLGDRIRDGSLDVVLLRPAPALAQLAADRFALRRLGRVVQGGAVLGWSLAALPVQWTWGRAVMVPLLLVCGTAIFCAVFVVGAAFQFWAPGGAEAQNALTYGGGTLLQFPPTVFGRELVRGVVYGVPLAFVNWLPAMYVLGRPLPFGLPPVLRFGAPVAAVVCAAVAGAAWRAGLRSYRSTGS